LNTHLQFPDWPVKRLVAEAVVAWGFRHPESDFVNYRTAPWPQVRTAIFAFLRHQLSDFDEQLRVRYERDQALRDELVRQVNEAAFRKYPWLANDPRPFPEFDESGLLLDNVAKQLADLHSLRQHLSSAIRDLKRMGNQRGQIAELQEKAAKADAKIRSCTHC
jgi:hypothetical protein